VSLLGKCACKDESEADMVGDPAAMSHCKPSAAASSIPTECRGNVCLEEMLLLLLLLPGCEDAPSRTR